MHCSNIDNISTRAFFNGNNSFNLVHNYFTLKTFFMKRVIAAFIISALGFTAHAQTKYLGLQLGGNYMIMTDPSLPDDQNPGSINGMGFNAMLAIEWGLNTFDNTRFGFESGYASALSLKLPAQTVAFPLPNDPAYEITLEPKVKLDYIPLHATIGFHSFKRRKSLSFYGKLGLGAVYGFGGYSQEEVKVDLGTFGGVDLGEMVVVEASSESGTWFGGSGKAVFGIRYELSREKEWYIDFNAGYHAMYGKYKVSNDEMYDDFYEDKDAELISDITFQIGIFRRFW